MKKKRTLQKVAIWLGSILIVLAVGGYFGINYAADKVLNSLMDTALESALEESIAEETDVTSTSTNESIATPAADDSSSSSEMSAGTPGKGNVKGGANTNQASPEKQKSTAAPSASTPSKSGNVMEYSKDISVEKAKAVKENITFSEKTKVMSVMLKRLSPSEIKQLSELAKGGMTVEKKKQAKKIILQKLTEEEYNELIAIAAKYGLSQGKSYKDSLKQKLD
jgi:predicted outer membrane protein